MVGAVCYASNATYVWDTTSTVPGFSEPQQTTLSALKKRMLFTGSAREPVIKGLSRKFYKLGV
jgi:hypothetical protein